MSGPFVYTPSTPSHQDLAPSPYLYRYHNQQRISPHIPTVNLAGPSAPNTPIRDNRILDEDPWSPPHARTRRPSWHAGMATPFLNAPTLTVPADSTHTRRRSFDNRYQRPNFVDYYQSEPQTPHPWMVPGAPVVGPRAPPSQIHPLLRPESHEIYFDLSLFEFRPVDARGRPIPVQILTEPATHPPTTRLVINSDQLPQWPVLLDYHAATFGTPYSPSALPPITVGDVLHAIHKTMQTQVTHKEWAKLDEREEAPVARAYTRRYKLAAGHESRLAADGVKRVDYLLRKVMFAGLTRRNGDQGYENFKLLVKTR